MSLRTTSAEVIETFASTGRARGRLHWWEGLKGREYVVARVKAHVAEAVYRVRSSDVRALATDHALGRIRPAEGYAVRQIRDWRPDFAMAHLFHFCLERSGGLFAYEEFRRFCSTDESGAGFGRQAKEKIAALVEQDGWTAEAARESMRWRVGLAYYSFLREMFVIARLRELGLDMRAHPLADALFLADAWRGRDVVELFVSNAEFKHGAGGRKKTPQDLLGDQDKFRIIRLAMEPQHQWGVVHLPTENEIQLCALQLR